jgi:hypothetical protein
MKEELRAMEAHLKELKALKRYKEAERLKEELCQLKTRLSELQAENGRLKKQLTLNTNAEREACELREALNQTRDELCMLKEVKGIINGKHLTVEEAARKFVKAREAEISGRVENEVKALREKFEAEAPELIYRRLLAILKKSHWPAEIAQIIEKKAEEKAQSKLGEEFQQRVHEDALGRLEEVKQTQWRPFVEEKAARISSNLVTLVAELQGTWRLTCDRCHRRVTAEVSPVEIAALLKGERVAECPNCMDLNLPPAPPVAPHKINGSALEDLLEAYLAEKGPPGKATSEPSQKESHPLAGSPADEKRSTTL